MQAGLLTDIISFLHPQTIRDALGGTSERWTEAFKKRACVRYKSGTRKEINGEVLNTHTITIMVRYSRDISEKMRIVYEGRKYKIAFIHPDRKAQSITIEAELINE